MNLQDSNAALEQFINDFKLKDPNGVVSFTAIIHLFFKGRLKIFQSEVQIITSNQLNTIYLVSGRQDGGNLPEMLDPHEYDFDYFKMENLRVKSIDSTEMTMIVIFPK